MQEFQLFCFLHHLDWPSSAWRCPGLQDLAVGSYGKDENYGSLVTLPSLRWTSSLKWQCLSQAGMLSWWNISVRIHTRRWACLCTPLREPPSKGCSTSTPAHTGKLRTGKGEWEDPAQGFPFTVRPSLSSLCRSPARDTQHHLAVFYLDSEASIRLTAEQAHFFLVKPLEPLPQGGFC